MLNRRIKKIIAISAWFQSLILIFFLLSNERSFGQATTCAAANPFCTGTTYNFPASTNPPTAQSGPYYDCLYTQPYPCWYYLQISQAGSLTLNIGSTANVDVDYCCWGPFTSFSSICNNLVASTVTDCSYSTASVETCTIPNAQVGEYYMVMITNYSGATTNITLSQTGGTGATNCNIVNNCVITSCSATPSACDPNTNTYTLNGSVTFNTPPYTGVLTITDCSGNSVMYNPFFSSPINYSIPNLTANGSACSVTATFSSSSQPCTFTQNYTQPANCTPCYTPATDFTFTTPTCFPGTSTLNYQGTAGSGAVYMWNFNSGVALPGTGAGPQTVTWPTDGQTYNVTLSVSLPGCDTTSATHSITVPSQVHLDSVKTVPDSCGLHLGSIDVYAHGGTGTLQYSIGGAAGTASSFPNMPSGPYHIVVTDNSGCSVTKNDTVHATGSLTAGFIPDANQCLQGNTFNFTNTGSTGTGINYYWSLANGVPSVSTAIDPSGIFWNVPGIFPIHQTISLGSCQADSIINIQVFPMPNFIITYNNVRCHGQCNGFATVNPSNNAYQWDINTGAQTTQTATNLCPGTYYVTVTNPYGCTSHDSTTITEPGPLTVTTAGTGITCWGYANGTVTSTVTGGMYPYTYQWSNGSISPNIVNLNANTYTVTVTDANGCSAVSSQIITQPYALSYTSHVIDESCAGGSNGSIVLHVSYGASPYYYMWSTGATDSLITNVPANNYSVTVTDNNGCTFTVPFMINEPTAVHVVTSNNATICIGQVLTVSAVASGGTGPYSYTWSNGENHSTIHVSPSVTTIYHVYAKDTHGCVSNNPAVYVSVHGPLSLSLHVSDHSICQGNSIKIFASATGGDGNYTFKLENTNSNFTSPVTVFPEQSGIYSVSVQDGCGTPSVSDTLNVHVNLPPPINVSSDVVSGCQPLTVNFKESSADYGQKYAWNFGDVYDINISNHKNPRYTYGFEGVYTVTLTVTSTAGCSSYLSFPDMISVYKNPVAKFYTDPEVGDVLNPVIYFMNKSSFNDHNRWSFGDGDTSIAESPTHTYLFMPHIYSIQLIVETDHNCADTTTGTIEIKDVFTFFAPTAFTPDGDKVNDVFVVKGNGIDPDQFVMYIFDRWGEQIYQTNNLYKGWDGKFSNGTMAETGEYTWLVVFRDMNGIEFKKFGRVNLLK